MTRPAVRSIQNVAVRTAARRLRLVAPTPVDPARAPARPAVPAGGDLWLLVLVLAVCLVPLVGLATGGPWGAGSTGLATAGVLLSGGGLVHGLWQRRQTRD